MPYDVVLSHRLLFIQAFRRSQWSIMEQVVPPSVILLYPGHEVAMIYHLVIFICTFDFLACV